MSHNDHIEEYENALRKAEADIEEALRAICPLRGEFPRGELMKALEVVQDAIRGTWKLYK